MKLLKQSTSVVIPFGPFVSPTDAVTLQTGLVSAIDHATTGIFLNKNGAAGAVRSATVTASTYDAYGNYLVTLSATDTNTLGLLRVSFAAAASCLPVFATDYVVVTANIYDSWIAGTSNLVTSLTGDLTATMKTSVTTAVMSSVVEGSTTVVQTMRGFASALYGKCSGLATTTAVYRDAGDTKNRITATVDVDGNRSAITTDLT